MTERVAIVGVGQTQFRTTSPDVSYKEMMFEAAVKAYKDAGVNPRKEVGSFIGVSEDFWEGTSIFDEYLPDQIGGAMRPVCTIGNEGIHGVATGAMHILTGLVDVVAVESHSKVSECVYQDSVLSFGFDPVLNRPLRFGPHAVAGLEMARYLADSGNTREDCAEVVVKNRLHALANPHAAYGAHLDKHDILNSSPVASPLNKLDMAEPADGSIVLVLASEEKARKLTDNPVWIDGMGWANDSASLEGRDWAAAESAAIAARMAYKMAGIKSPINETDFAEVDDTYSYKELQHLEALGICGKGEAGKHLREGGFELAGPYPVNVSGGSIGMGNLLDANGLSKIAEGVLQLRGEAGPRQVDGAQRAIIQGWRGIPTTSNAVLVLSNDNEEVP